MATVGLVICTAGLIWATLSTWTGDGQPVIPGKGSAKNWSGMTFTFGQTPPFIAANYIIDVDPYLWSRTRRDPAWLVGRRTGDIRVKLEKTQEEMAHALATSSRQYIRWENDHVPLPDDIEGRLKNLRLGVPKTLSRYTSLALIEELEKRARKWIPEDPGALKQERPRQPSRQGFLYYRIAIHSVVI